MPINLAAIFSKTAGEVVGKVMEGADGLFTSKEEKLKLQNEITAKLAELELERRALLEKEFETQVADTKSARDSNVSIQTSDKAPLFNKLVPYIIASFTTLIWGGMTVYVIGSMLNIIKRDPSVNFEGVLGVYAGLTGTYMVVLNFFFGSSKSSEDKQSFMQKMMSEK